MYTLIMLGCTSTMLRILDVQDVVADNDNTHDAKDHRSPLDSIVEPSPSKTAGRVIQCFLDYQPALATLDPMRQRYAFVSYVSF